MDIKHYEAIGTMSEALSMHANEAFDELTDDQKVICEYLFKAITEKRGENFGIRRPTRLGEIAAIADVSEEDVIEVVDKFREPGRSLLTPAFTVPLEAKSMVDISHESLMRIWVRLKNWVDDEAEAVQNVSATVRGSSYVPGWQSRPLEASGFTISTQLAGKTQNLHWFGVNDTILLSSVPWYFSSILKKNSRPNNGLKNCSKSVGLEMPGSR